MFTTTSFSRLEIGKMGIELYVRSHRGKILHIRYTKLQAVVLWKP